tara:strand:+ start:830 stop:1276 length:447 start_codon:yes stop_codon:yes gene_type:complete
MNDLESKIKCIVNRILSANQKIININCDAGTGYVRIILDGEKNISLNDTTKMTKKLKKSVDFIDLFPKGYRLEVTSSGLESPLKYPFQYRKNIGRKINITLDNKFNNSSIEALIKDANETHLFLVIHKENLKIEYKSIIIAKLIILFN